MRTSRFLSLLSIASVAVVTASRGSATAGTQNATVTENARPGSHDWQVTRVALDRIGGSLRSPRIEAYNKRDVE